MGWYCLHLKSRLEFVAEKGLIEQSFEVYLPKTVDRKIHRKPKVKPLFPAYMFIFLKKGIDDFKVVKYTKGVRSFAPRIEPLTVPVHIIENLKNRERSGFTTLDENTYKKGDDVTIISGPFSMYEGTIKKTDKDRIWVIFEEMGVNVIEINSIDLKFTN